MSYIQGVMVKQLKVVPDGRGRLMEILRVDDEMFSGFGQVYLTTTFPGVVKAWHLHREQTDHICCIQGVIRLGIIDQRPDSPTLGQANEFFLSERRPMVVRVPAGLYHGWKCVGTREAIIINTVNRPYNYASPDEERLHPHENSLPWDWSHQDG